MSVRSAEEIQRSREEARESAARYVAAEILPALGGRPPIRLESSALGAQSLVWFLEVEGLPAMVLRADPVRRRLARRAQRRLAGFRGFRPENDISAWPIH